VDVQCEFLFTSSVILKYGEHFSKKTWISCSGMQTCLFYPFCRMDVNLMPIQKVFCTRFFVSDYSALLLFAFIFC